MYRSPRYYASVPKKDDILAPTPEKPYWGKPTDPISGAQRTVLEGMDFDQSTDGWTKAQASAKIAELKAVRQAARAARPPRAAHASATVRPGPSPHPVPTGAVAGTLGGSAAPPYVPTTHAGTATGIPLPLVEMVPDGYYAVQEEDGAVIRFMRLSTRGRNSTEHFKRKIQTIHGDELKIAWGVYDNGIDTFAPLAHIKKSDVILLIVDWQSAAIRFAREKKRCGRCGKGLTDMRSLHYNIGPECEKAWRWMIDLVDAQHGGVPFERMQ